MPVTLNKLKSARAGCEKLVAKLCADLPPGSANLRHGQRAHAQLPAAALRRDDEALRRSHRAAEADRSAGWHADWAAPVVRAALAPAVQAAPAP